MLEQQDSNARVTPDELVALGRALGLCLILHLITLKILLRFNSSVRSLCLVENLLWECSLNIMIREPACCVVLVQRI